MLYTYEQKPEDKKIASFIDVVNLNSIDGRRKVILEPLVTEIDVIVDNGDLSLVISIETSPNTTCWPPKNFTFMVSSPQEKGQWYNGKFFLILYDLFLR